jgi:hypothetical protein
MIPRRVAANSRELCRPTINEPLAAAWLPLNRHGPLASNRETILLLVGRRQRASWRDRGRRCRSRRSRRDRYGTRPLSPQRRGRPGAGAVARVLRQAEPGRFIRLRPAGRKAPRIQAGRMLRTWCARSSDRVRLAAGDPVLLPEPAAVMLATSTPRWAVPDTRHPRPADRSWRAQLCKRPASSRSARSRTVSMPGRVAPSLRHHAWVLPAGSGPPDVTARRVLPAPGCGRPCAAPAPGSSGTD